MTGKAGLCQNRSEETLKNGSLKAGRNQLSQTGNKTGIGYQIQGVGNSITIWVKKRSMAFP